MSHGQLANRTGYVTDSAHSQRLCLFCLYPLPLPPLSCSGGCIGYTPNLNDGVIGMSEGLLSVAFDSNGFFSLGGESLSAPGPPAA